MEEIVQQLQTINIRLNWISVGVWVLAAQAIMLVFIGGYKGNDKE